MAAKQLDFSERLFRLVVRFYFGALLAIISYLSIVSALVLIFDSKSMAAWFVPILLLIDLFFIAACCLFGNWQRQRLPRKWWMVIMDTAVSGLIVFALMYWVSDGKM